MAILWKLSRKLEEVLNLGKSKLRQLSEDQRASNILVSVRRSKLWLTNSFPKIKDDLLYLAYIEEMCCCLSVY